MRRPEGGPVGPEARVAGRSHPISHPAQYSLDQGFKVSPARHRPRAAPTNRADLGSLGVGVFSGRNQRTLQDPLGGDVSET